MLETFLTTPSDNTESRHPFEIARFLTAFVECKREIQDIALEMAAIISDPESTDDERTVAFDALSSALFPGKTADAQEEYRQQLDSSEAKQATEEIIAQTESFAQRVRELMAQKGITQEQLAKLIDVGQPAISNLLNRRCRPQRRTIEKIAASLGVQAHEIWQDSP
jgi:DNA-binding XRE family transcriptional regulator